MQNRGPKEARQTRHPIARGLASRSSVREQPAPYPRVSYPRGLVLFHAAARLRAGGFNYISQETALSDAGVISQVPINWISALKAVPAARREFVKEMQRFLPAATVRETVEQESYWDYLSDVVRSEGAKAMSAR